MHPLALRQSQVPPESADTPYVIFALGAQRYAIAIQHVIEIVRLPGLTILSGAAPYVCGLINWHGQHLPTIDGRALVGEPPSYDLSCQIMLIGAGNAQYALLVDSVERVWAPPASALTQLPRQSVAPFLAAIFQERDGASTIVLDASALLELVPALIRPGDQGRPYGAPLHN